MKNFKIYFVLTCLAFLSVDGFSLPNEKMKANHVVEGSVMKDGQEIKGYIRKMGTTITNGQVLSFPSGFQKGVMFIEKEAFEKADKLKNRDFTVYRADDIEGYKYNGDSLEYESVKYSDMSAVGTGMVSKKMFLRKISEDKISIYHHFDPIEMPIGSESPNYVYKVGKDGNLKPIGNMNIKKELADCPTVVEKYEKGEYGIAAEGGKVSRLTKLVDATNNRDDVRMNVIIDYNNNCK